MAMSRPRGSALAAWRGGWTGELASENIARLSVERRPHRRLSAGVRRNVLQFIVLPGPMGAVLYRAPQCCWPTNGEAADAGRRSDADRAFARRIRQAGARRCWRVLDWIPVRLTALSFAIVGDFEDAAYCWRMQAKTWPEAEGGQPSRIILASGAARWACNLGGDRSGRSAANHSSAPSSALARPASPKSLPSAVGPRLARAGAVAAAHPADHAGQLGAVIEPHASAFAAALPPEGE